MEKTNDVIIMSECSDFTAEQLDFILEMCEQSVVKKPIKHKAKDVKVQYRCKDTVDRVDMLNSEDSLKFIGIDEGVDITNDLNSLTKEKYFKPKEKQIENNAWNGDKNKRFSGYKIYY